MDCVDLEDVLEHVIANVHEQLQHHLRSIQAQHAEHLVARQEQHVAHMTELAGRMSRDALHVMRPLPIPRTSSSTETDADDMRTSERSFGSVFTKQSGHLHVEADDVDGLGISRENSWNPEPGCVSEESGWKRTRRSSRGCSVVLMTGASDATVDSHLTEALSVDKPLSSDRSGRTNLLASYEIGTDVQALQAARGWAGTGTSPGARAKEERPSGASWPKWCHRRVSRSTPLALGTDEAHETEHNSVCVVEKKHEWEIENESGRGEKQTTQ